MVKNKPSRRKYILAAGFLLLLLTYVIAVLSFSSNSYSESELIIRKAAAVWLLFDAHIKKDPNDLTDEDFAKIKEFRLSAADINQRNLLLSNIKMLEKFTNLENLTLENITFPKRNVPKWMKFLSKLGFIDLQKRTELDLSPLRKLHNLREIKISVTSITNLNQLTELTNLNTLTLFRTNISDLESIKKLTGLRFLVLFDCLNITNEQVEELRETMPNLKIDYSSSINVPLMLLRPAE